MIFVQRWIFKQFHIAETIMDVYQVKPLIGVVPDCKDADLQISDEKSDFWGYVLALQKKRLYYSDAWIEPCL